MNDFYLVKKNKMKLKPAILLFIACLTFEKIFSQADTVFWFAAPEITENIKPTPEPHTDRPILLRVTAFIATANVTITQPANPAFTPITFFVPPNSSQSIDLTSRINSIECKPANTVLNFGLKISSDNLITAYYEENSSSNPEMFVLKGRNALGTSFFIPMQNIMNNWDFYAVPNPLPSNSFDIVATEDNTQITITPAKDIIGHPAGVAFTITLNRGQVYSATAVGRNAADHLMGSTVTSTKPIAITLKDDSIGGAGYSGCLDLAGDQIIPLNLIGKKYITLPGFLNDPLSQPTDQVFFLATQNNTSITINGVLETTINTGQTYRRISNNQVLYIETSNPVYALHLTGFGCEVGHAVLPQIECTGSSTVAFTRSANENLFMNILVPSGYENQFTFNGNPNFIIGSLFQDVPFTSGQWKYATIPVSLANLGVGNGVIVRNTGIEFHLSIVHGDGRTGCRYGYFSDFNTLDVNITSSAVGGALCENGSLQFFTDFKNALAVGFNWTGPNGFTSNIANPTINNIGISGTGTYTLTANKFSCTNATKSLPIIVNPIPTPNPTSNSPICRGSTLNLFASYPGATYNWTGPNAFNSIAQNPIRSNTTIQDSGTYSVTATANGCSGTATTRVQLLTSPTAKITPSNNSPLTCRFNSLSLSGLTGTVVPPDTLYNWVGPNGFSNNTSNINFPSVNYSDTGLYFLTTRYLGCSTSDSFRVRIQPAPKLVFPPIPSLCSNNGIINLIASDTTGVAGIGTFTGNGVSGTTFNPANASNGNNTIFYTYNTPGGCNASASQIVNVWQAPIINMPKKLGVVAGNSVQINAAITGGSNNTFTWNITTFLDNPLILNPNSKPTRSITYELEAVSDSGCISSDTVRIELASNLFIPNVFSPNQDGINDQWVVEDLAGVLLLRANIFDRYGKLVHTSLGYRISWDGKYEGKPLPVATYYYVIVVNDGRTSRNIGGWVQLLR